MSTGTHDINSLLTVDFQSVVEYGMDTVQEVLQADLAAHNEIVLDMVGNLCEITTDRQRIYGSSVNGQMIEVDEYGRPPTQVVKSGSTVAFPLRKFAFALGWTSTWFKVHTPADMARAVLNGQKAHFQRVQQEIRRAVFGATNYSFNDHLVDKVDLAVKRFVNADGAPIADGPNGETFDGLTHTHYAAVASVTEEQVLALIEDVVEHGHGAAVKLVIARADETAVRSFASFQPYVDPRMVYRVSDTPAAALDIARVDNRAIGILGAAEVWVKPWGLADYYFCYDADSPGKPLAFRQREQTSLQGLAVAAALDTHPLYAQYMEAEFGIGVWTRTNGAALYTGGGTWADPIL